MLTPKDPSDKFVFDHLTLKNWFPFKKLKNKESQNIPVIYSRLMREFLELKWTEFYHKANEKSKSFLPKVYLYMLWNAGWESR